MTPPPLFVVVPGRLDTPTGGFVYDRCMIAGLRANGRCAGVVVLPGAFPKPSAEAMRAAATQLAALPAGAWVVVDGLALTPLAALFEHQVTGLKVIALIHHPLCDEPGLTPEARETLFVQECGALAKVEAVIVTSDTTRRRLADFGTSDDRAHVVLPGAVDRLPSPRPCRRGHPTAQLLCVGSLIPRKGQDLLLDALAGLRRTRWRLTLIGPSRDASFARRLRMRARTMRLAERILFRGAVAAHRLRACYAAADVFVLPSRHEGFGIVLVEALAHGLPVLAARAGAIPEALPDGSATLVATEDVKALQSALRPLVTRREARLRAAARTRRFARSSRRWQTAAHEFQTALERIIAQ